MGKGTFRLVCALAALTLFSCAPGFSQSGQGVVTGTVSDATGASIPNATVKLTNAGTNVAQTQATARDGGFRFGLVPPGNYTLSVKADGFTEKQIPALRVDPSQVVPVNLTLAVATASSTVDVESKETLVQTATSDLATTVNSTTIANTALLTRNVYDLAFLAPSVTQGMNFGIASGGARESGTAFILNGADNNDNFSEGNNNITPPLESVAEFSILTNSMSAQYGRGAGAIVSAAQKSGSNQLHGVVYEFNRNRTLNASDFFQNRQGSDKPNYIRNQFGGEVDGPVLIPGLYNGKNRTFFAFAYDRIDLRTGSDLDSVVFTPTELTTLTKGASPLAAKLISSYNPLTSTALCPDQKATAPDSIGHLGCIHVYNPNNTGANNYYWRIDHNFSQKDRIAFSANLNRSNFVDAYGAYLGNFATTVTPYPATDTENYHNFSLVETHVFSPRVLNEFTISHNRHYSNTFAGQNGVFNTPTIYLDNSEFGLSSGLGPNSEQAISAFTQDRWSLSNNFSWIRGKHSFKFGGGFQYGIVYRNWDLGGNGLYEFGSLYGPTPAADGVLNKNGTISGIEDSTNSNFQKDYPYFMETSIDPATGAKANAYRHYIGKDANLFFQDDWKVTRRFTLNLGLRWDRYGAPTEANGKIAQFTTFCGFTVDCIKNARVGAVNSMWTTNNKDFGPRVGFAWDVFGNGRLALRGGYGINYDRIFDNVWSNGAWNPPFYALVDLDASGSDSIFYSVPTSVGGSYVPGSIPGPAGRAALRTMDVHMRDASVQNLSFGVDTQIKRNFLLRVGYQGSLGRHLPQLMNVNRADGLRYNPTLASTAVPNDLYNGFNYRANNISSNFNSLVTEIQKRMSGGLQFQFSYMWSKLLDSGSALFTGETIQGSYSQPYYFVSNQHPELQYGAGAFDHKQALKFSVIYELPFLKSQQGFIGQALGGWTISAFYQGYSGHPLDIYNTRAKRVGDGKDPNGYAENVGGEYNLDSVANDHPFYQAPVGRSIYSGNSPADGIFIDNHKIGCGVLGGKSSAASLQACSNANAVGTPNAYFINPPGYGVRYGIGRNLFRGPWFNGVDAAIFKSFRLHEAAKLQIRGEALNMMNHPNFDGIDTNVNSSTFGRAQILAGQSPARRFQIGARLSF